MSPPHQAGDRSFRPPEAGFEQPERRKQEFSDAARDSRAAERARADKTSKLRTLRLQKEEAERLALAALVVPPKKKAAPRAKKKVESITVRRGHGSA